jgi:Uma2 family endonuclease
MTVTASVPWHSPWTVDDLEVFTDDGNRYEIVDGSLLVSASPPVRHGVANERLRDLLKRQAPSELWVMTVGLGIGISGRTTFYIPDLLIVSEAALRRDPGTRLLQPADVPLVAEVLSPSNRRVDLILKRHDYGAAGIQQYWIVDPAERALTVLVLDEGATSYREAAVLHPGEVWQTDQPYPISVDPAEIF